jgi:flagellin-like protein
MQTDTRAASEVTGTVLLVATVVVLAAAVTAAGLGAVPAEQAEAPQVAVSHSLVTDGNERTVAVTLEGGDVVRTNRLYVTASTDVDVGGAPGSAAPANDDHASGREKLAEASGGSPQVDVGPTWDAGETVYLDPEGDATGVTIRFYWNTDPVRGKNPGTVTGEDAYLIAEFTTTPT